MPDFAYMNTAGKIGEILAKVKVAQTPPKFSHEFLTTHLGFTSSRDRPIIKIMKQLGFLTPDGIPTSRYNEFRSDRTSGKAMAKGLREGWADIFLSDQDAHLRSATELKEIFKNVSGKSESVASKMASTFSALTQLADFDAVDDPTDVDGSSAEHASSVESGADEETPAAQPIGGKPLELHNDIHVHLPPTSDVAVYTAIFRALREELLG